MAAALARVWRKRPETDREPDAPDAIAGETAQTITSEHVGERLAETLTAVERLAARCLEILASLGGEGSSAEIRDMLQEGGLAVPANRISEALNVLARQDPPAVAHAGPRHPGRGRPTRWRLADPDDPGRSWEELSRERSQNAARNIRALREARGMRQRDLARAVGIAQSSVSHYERGGRISMEQAEVIAAVLGTTAEALTGEAGS
jgi:DNA-binding XRE family transcriptional regulator